MLSPPGDFPNPGTEPQSPSCIDMWILYLDATREASSFFAVVVVYHLRLSPTNILVPVFMDWLGSLNRPPVTMPVHSTRPLN